MILLVVDKDHRDGFFRGFGDLFRAAVDDVSDFSEFSDKVSSVVAELVRFEDAEVEVVDVDEGDPFFGHFERVVFGAEFDVGKAVSNV